MTFDPTITIGGLFTLLATLGLYLYQWLDKGRARKWAKEDAELVAADLKKEAAAIAEKIADKLADEAAKVAAAAAERSEKLVVTVADNITASEAARRESNEWNKKYATLAGEMIELRKAVNQRRRQ